MRQYHMDVTLLARFEVEAESREEAERIIRGICDGGICRVTEKADNQETIEGTCEVEGEIDLDHTE